MPGLSGRRAAGSEVRAQVHATGLCAQLPMATLPSTFLLCQQEVLEGAACWRGGAMLVPLPSVESKMASLMSNSGLCQGHGY